MINSPKETYDIDKVVPKLILDSERDRLEGFFLTLAVIYNDLKSILHVQKDYFATHETPKEFKTTGYDGEFNGMNVQFFKTRAGVINEILVFINRYQDVFEDPRFKTILGRLPKRTRERFSEVLQAAHGRKGKVDKHSLAYKLMRIRNDVAFHYDKSEKVLRKAYKEFFDGKRPESTFAYYAYGKTMEKTRFFYADAAIQSYMMMTAKGAEGTFEERMAAYADLEEDSFKLLQDVNVLFASLLIRYIRLREEEAN